MIDVLSGRALVERFAADPVEIPATESAREWVESLTSHLPAAEAFTVVEHLFGVLPLLATFFEPRGAIAEAASGVKLGALGLFTPTPELRWFAAAVEGEASGGGLLLRGEVRIPSPAADGSIVLVHLEGPEHRLAWLEHGVPGVERRGSRTGGPVRGDAPCWLAVEGAAVHPDLVSRPVAPDPGAELFRCLESYAGVWALAAAICARDGVRALRRAARTTGHQGTPFSTSQPVTMGITEVEIEAELTATAVLQAFALAPGEASRAGGLGRLALATAAARTLSAVAAKTAELRDQAGLALDGPLAGGAAVLTAFLGGSAMIETELGCALGRPDHGAGDDRSKGAPAP